MMQLLFGFPFSKVVSEQNYTVVTLGNLQEVFGKEFFSVSSQYSFKILDPHIFAFQKGNSVS